MVDLVQIINKEGSMESVSVRLNKKMHDELSKVAKANGFTQSFLLNLVLKNFLKDKHGQVTVNLKEPQVSSEMVEPPVPVVSNHATDQKKVIEPPVVNTNPEDDPMHLTPDLSEILDVFGKED
jgi:hypothetical protein